MRIPARTLSGALLASALLATGCGSTAHVGGATRSGDAALDAAGAHAGEGAGAPLVAPAAPLDAGGRAATDPPTASPRVGAAAADRSSAAVGPRGTLEPGRDGPGVTDRAIYIGLSYSTNADAANQAAGAGAITHGDERAVAEAVLDDINRHGGAAGRRLVPVWHAFDGTSTETRDQQWQAACTDWTQDHKVFSVRGIGPEAFQRCIQHAGAVQIDDNLPTADASLFQRYPGLFELCCPSLDRIAAQQVPALADQGYFTSWDAAQGRAGNAPVKVGVITFDHVSFRGPVGDVLLPGLARLGYRPEVAFISPSESSAQLTNEAAAVQSAVLKFRTGGVTHVLLFEASGELSLLFLNNARSQQYYPRYGVNTGTYFQGLLQAGLVHPNQLNGTVGFSWAPVADLPAELNPPDGPYSNASRRHCLRVMKEHGQAFDSNNAELVALIYCSELYFLRDVLDRTGPVITRDTFVAAADNLGSRFVSGDSLGQLFRRGRHDGVSRIYYWNYFSDCTCMHYTGPRRTIP